MNKSCKDAFSSPGCLLSWKILTSPWSGEDVGGPGQRWGCRTMAPLLGLLRQGAECGSDGVVLLLVGFLSCNYSTWSCSSAPGCCWSLIAMGCCWAHWASVPGQEWGRDNAGTAEVFAREWLGALNVSGLWLKRNNNNKNQTNNLLECGTVWVTAPWTGVPVTRSPIYLRDWSTIPMEAQASGYAFSSLFKIITCFIWEML